MKIDIQKLQAAIRSQDVSKSELARRSGISRTAIYGILRDADKQVREETVRRLAATLNLAPGYITLGGVPSSYGQWLIEQHEGVDFHGLGLGQLKPVALRSLYVPTRVVADSLGTAGTSDQASRESQERSLGNALPEAVEFHEAALRHDRIVLLGDPGSGKTTLARQLTAELARQRRSAADAPAAATITPVFVRLAEFGKQRELDGSLDLVAFVAACVRRDGCPDPEKFLRDELRRGRCIVLLDGLDELGRDAAAAELTRFLAAFVGNYPRNRFVITSRRAGFDAGPWQKLGFANLAVAPWDDDQMRLFVDRWYAEHAGGTSARVRAEAAQRADALSAAILENPRLRAVATSPLMLSILAALHHGHAVLPRRRAELYAKIADTLLQSWEAAKFSARPGDLLHGAVLEGREYAWLLGHVALSMQQHDLTVAPHWWLADHVCGYLRDTLGLDLARAKGETDRVIRYLDERAGLLVQRGRGLYAFWHLTFQEYFAAEALLMLPAADGGRGLLEVLGPHLHHPRWTEVVRLVVSQLTPTQTPALLRAILDDPDPVGRFLHRGPLLALGCLADGAVVADGRLVEEIFRGVLELGTSRWLEITFDALRTLRQFDGTRLEATARSTLEGILQSAEKHLGAGEAFRLRQVGDEQFRRRIDRALRVPGGGRPKLGTIVAVDCQGGRASYYFLDPQLRAADPKQWYDRAERLLLADDTHEGLQVALVRAMAGAVRTTARAGEILKTAFRSSQSDRVRRECIDGIGRLVGDDPDVQEALLDACQRDTSDDVRQASAAALRHVAADPAVGQLLLSMLRSDQSATVRAGAAIGLKDVGRTDDSVCASMQKIAHDENEDEIVRIFCLGSLDTCLADDAAVMELFVDLLDADGPLCEVASEVLAKAMTRGRIAWDGELVGRIEANLMRSATPRGHHRAALQELANAREMLAAPAADHQRS